MRLPAVLFASLLTILSAFGQAPRPNTLTPKEVADGWLLLFDGESTFGWKVEGAAAVKDGVLTLGGQQAAAAGFTTHFGYGDLTFEANLEKARGAEVSVPKLSQKGLAGLAENQQGWQAFSVRYRAEWITLGGNPGAGVGAKIKDGTITDPFALSFHVPAGQTLLLRNVKFQPAGLQSIFTGKDLSGWKEHPGKKSKFAVQGGAINIKDGPGDLQTEGQWADFVLQLECISNGKHLNSGIFFRCIPGQYQNGYEAQVRNQFTPEATQDYTIEVYDPATNKLVDKQKIKSPAIDFGTGAIYRRMPARKELARDGEWFTMTVVAHVRHIATWVNGVQQVDWTDQRAAHENPRNGYRAEKGPISLQGHDPTTDLSFRSFRIAELPRP